MQRKQQSWFQILPPDGAQEESILANYIQCSNKEEERTRKKLLTYAQEKTPQHRSTQNQSTTLKLSNNIIKQQEHNTPTACAAAGKTK
jgi:hypothetical protein